MYMYRQMLIELDNNNNNNNSIYVNSILAMSAVVTQLIVAPVVIVGGTVLIIGATGEHLINGNTTHTCSIAKKIYTTVNGIEKAFINTLTSIN